MHMVRWLFARPDILVALLALLTIILLSTAPGYEKSTKSDAYASEANKGSAASTTKNATAAAQNAEVSSKQQAQGDEAAPSQAKDGDVVSGAGAVSVNASSPEDLLRAAREAYWSEEFERAIEFYNALLAQDKQPAYQGELANVYWKKGDSQAAVDLYVEIAPWLAEEGRMQELSGLKAYADLVDPAKAQEIAKYLK